ncbi:MAG TPA: RHS repeat-associated core domain-containing protein [Pyrinomonadaceae bacterium]|nr:RHS repeat-associated core domain-containing protein [Pyrinomonadaceae bacterium]
MITKSLFLRALNLSCGFLAACVVVFLIPAQSYGQERANDGSTPLAMTPGAPAGSYQLSGFDNVNLFNGHLNFQLSLLEIGGRGAGGFRMVLPIEHTWGVFTQKNEITGVITRHPEPNEWQGIRPGYGFGVMHARKSGDGSAPCSGGQFFRYAKTLTRLTFTQADGTEYELRDQLTAGEPKTPVSCFAGFNRGKNFVSADGSAAVFISDSDIIDTVVVAEGITVTVTGYLLLPDGTRIRLVNGKTDWIRDRNGNKLSFTYDAYSRVTSIKDSIERQITISYAPLNSPGTDLITYKGFGGASRTISVNRDHLEAALGDGQTLQNTEELFPQLNGNTVVDFNPIIVKSVTLPNNLQYQFKYNSFGELQRVVLPTGGAIEYDHLGGTSDGDPNGVVGPVIYRRLIERREYPDGGTGSAYSLKTTYSRPESITTNLGYVTTDKCTPSGTLGQCGAAPALLSREHHYFNGCSRCTLSKKGSDYSSWSHGREYKTEILSADGTTVLRRSETTFAQRAPVTWWTGIPEAEPPNDTRVIETKTTIEPSGANLVTKQVIVYDDTVPYNNPSNTYDYAFGTGTPGALLRRQETVYVTGSNYVDAFIGAHLRRLPIRTSIFDSNNVERARTTLEYDVYTGGGNHAALIDRANISGFDASFTTSYTTRGNVTATKRYLFDGGVPGGAFTAYAQYDIAGNVVKTIDPGGCQTDLFYDDRFGSHDGEARANASSQELIAAGKSSFGFASRITNCLAHAAYKQLDYYTLLSVDEEDANGIVSGIYSADTLERPTKIIRAANGGTSAKSQTTFNYDDIGRKITTTTDQASYNDNVLKTEKIYDGFGRTTETRTYEGGSNYIAVRQEYDALGRPFRVSNPFRNGGALFWTTSAFDSLGRQVSVTTPDNAVVTTLYEGNAVTVTDQAGKKRRSVTDALGRLARVDEPDGSNNLGSIGSPVQPTSYAYDVLGNLTTVTQGSQQRFFMYDALSRLIRARNPEQSVNGSLNLTDPITGNSQWSVGYQYDANGNLLVKTDARNASSHDSYDLLNRIVRRWYNGSSLVTDTAHNIPALPSGVAATDEAKYFYDSQTLPAGAPSYSRGSSIGRLVATTYANGGSSGDYFAFDALGRPTLKFQQTGGINYQTQRGYNLAGGVTSQTYPSGRSVSYSYDNAGRTASFTGYLGDGFNRTYASGINYSEWGGLSREHLGTDIPLFHKQRYTNRGQLFDMRVGTVNDADNWNRGAIINYYSLSNFGFGLTGTDTNGNLYVQQHWIPHNDQMSAYTVHQQNYDYDSLNRITWVGEYLNGATNTGGQSFTYDRWGNRLIHPASWGIGINNKQFTVDPAGTNRLLVPTGQSGVMSYDSAGNLSTDSYTGIGNRWYDAENRMISAQGGPQANYQYYNYDANGQRIIRTSEGVATWQVYGIDGELLAEYAANGGATAPQKEYGYRNGQLLITAEGVSGPAPILADDFNDNVRDVAKWNLYAVGPHPSPTYERNGRLEIQSEYSATESNYGGYITAATHNLNGKQTSVEVVAPTTANGGGGNYAGLSWGDSPYRITMTYSYIYYDNNSFYFDPVRDRHIRLRDDPATQTVYYESSSNGASWEVRATRYHGAVSLDYAIKLYNGNTAGWTSFDLVIFDNFRLELSGAQGNATINWLVADHLGTPRMIFDKTGFLANVKRHDYLPFGEELFAGAGGRTTSNGYSGDTVRQKFTSYERDNETGLDYAQARYYSSAQGRFTSIDPLMRSARIGEPQTFNRYSYVLNKPMNSTDPTGLCPKGRKCYTQKDEKGKDVEYYDLEDGTPVVVTHTTLIVSLSTVTAPPAFEPIWRSTRVWQIGPKAPPAVSGTGPGVVLKFLGAIGLILATPSSIGCGQTPNTVSAGKGGCMSTEPDVDTSANPDPDENKPDTSENQTENKDEKDAADPEGDIKKLSRDEIKKMKNHGIDIHELKGGKGASRFDLYKDSNGNVFIKRKGGGGEADPTGYNIRDFQ